MFNWLKVQRSLPGVIKAGVFVCLFSPLIISSDFFFPFIVPRNLLFRIVVEIIFALYILLTMIDRAYRPKFNKLFWAVLIYFGLIVLSSFTGLNVAKSWLGDFERMGGVIYSLHLLAYLIVLVGVFKKKEDWQQLLAFSLFASLLMSLIALAQYWHSPFILGSSGGDRLTALTGNAIYLAAYLLMHLFIIFYFWLRQTEFPQNFFIKCFWFFDLVLLVQQIFSSLSGSEQGILSAIFNEGKILVIFLILNAVITAWWFWRSRRLSVKVFLVTIFLFEFFIFWQTQTRGAIIAFGAAAAVLLLLNIYLTKDRRFKIGGVILAAAILLSPLAIYLARDSGWVQNNGTLRKLAAISATDITTQSRLLTWQASWQGILERPILGYGPENYYYVFNKRFPVEIYRDAGSQIWFDRSHNIIFDVGVTSGLVGLASYLAIYVLAFYYLFKNFRANGDFANSWVWLLALLAFFFQDFFVFDQLNTDVIFYLILAFIIFLINQNSPEVKTEKQNSWPVSPVALIILVLVWLGIFYQVNYQTYSANHYLFEALVNKTAGKYSQQSIDNYQAALKVATTGRFEIRQQLANYVLELVALPNLDLVKVQSAVKLADQELNNSISEEPLNVRHYLYLANFYNATAQFGIKRLTDSVGLLKQAEKLSPTRPQIYYALGQAYFYLQDFTASEQAFKAGQALAPWAEEPYFNLLAVYLFSGQPVLAQAEFNYLLTNQPNFFSEQNLDRLSNLYVQAKQSEQLIAGLQQLIKAQPGNSFYYTRLAALYLQNQQIPQAQAVAERIITLFPELASSARQFIDQLKTNPTTK
ncbi:MAG: O-antigen ligase family protein [Candidatus Buchananbacteria bacterium]